MAYFIRKNNGSKITFNGWITINMQNPLLNDFNTFSFSIDIPLTPDNIRSLEYPNNINTKNNKERLIEVDFISNTFQFRGILKINKTNKNSINGNFIGQGAFWKVFSGKKLSDLKLPDIQFPDMFNETFDNTQKSSYYYKIGDENAYCFPTFYNENFNKNSLQSFTNIGIINRYNITSGYDKTYGEKFSPFFFFRYVFNEIIKASGLDITYSDLNNKEIFNELLLYSNYNIVELKKLSDNKKGFYLVEKFYDSASSIIIETKQRPTNIIPKQSGFVYLKTEIPSDDNSIILDEDNFYVKRILRYIKISDYSFRIKKEDEGEINIEWDGRTYLANAFFLDIDINTITTVNLKEFISDITIKEFIKILDYLNIKIIPSESTNKIKIYNLDNVIVNSKYIDITNVSGISREKTLNSINGFKYEIEKPNNDEFYNSRVKSIPDIYNEKTAVNNITDLPGTGNIDKDIRYVKNENSYYVWRDALYYNEIDTVNGSWKFFSIGFKDIEVGTDEFIEISSKIVPLLNNIDILDFGLEKSYPRIDIPGNDIGTTDYSDPGFRFTLLADDVVIRCDYKNSNYSLKFDDNKGLYEQFWKYTLYWRQNIYRESVHLIAWPIHLLVDFAWEKKYRIKETNYLVKEIKLSISHDDQIKFGETTLVRT